MRITEPVIHKLFAMLRNQFGSYWVMYLGDRPITDVKAEWQAGLKPYTAELVGKVLADLKDMRPERPPTLDQFIKMMKDKKSCKHGHGSNLMWKTPELGKCSRQAADVYLTKLRGMV